MGKATNFARSINWGYGPDFKTIQISTKRAPAKTSGKVGSPVTNLTGVESSPLVLQDVRNRQGLSKAFGDIVGDSGLVQVWELYLKKCAHVDSGVNVNQLPDIAITDIVTVDGVDYRVRWADITHPFAFGDVLIVYLTEDKA